MAKNQLYPENKHIAVVADKDYTSGQPVAIGAYRGVVLVDAKEGDKVTVWLNGSYKIDVAGELTVGQVVYLNSSGALTATAGDTVWGVANVAKASGTGPAEVAPFGMLAPAAAGDSGK